MSNTRKLLDNPGVSMYHVFLVHSHITFLVAKCVVRHEELDKERVVLLMSRGFSPGKTHLRQVPITYTFNPESFPRQCNVFDSWRRLREIDRFFKELTGGRTYHFYTPQTQQRSFQIIKNSRKCTGFSFVEEGLGSYYTREELERANPRRRHRRFRDKIGYGKRIGASIFFDRGHSKAYGISPESFPGMERQVVLKDVFHPIKRDLPDVENVLVFDALSVFNQLKLDSALAAVRRVLDWLHSEGVETLHYKFHPAQLQTTEVEEFETLFEEYRPRIRLKPLGQEVCLEGLAAARPDVRFFVNVSSVGLYAALQGCQVFTYAPWVKEAEPGFAVCFDRAPTVFRQKVRPLA